MIQHLADFVDGFATWSTPVSFLAGIGVHHLWCKLWRDRNDEDGYVQEEG